jgi:hypothetical protein
MCTVGCERQKVKDTRTEEGWVDGWMGGWRRKSRRRERRRRRQKKNKETPQAHAHDNPSSECTAQHCANSNRNNRHTNFTYPGLSCSLMSQLNWWMPHSRHLIPPTALSQATTCSHTTEEWKSPKLHPNCEEASPAPRCLA